MDVSGDTSHYLVVYNSKNNQVAWRRKTDDCFVDARVTEDGTLFLVDGHSLNQINVFDGKTVTALDLETLSWPPTSLPKHRFIVDLENLEKELNIRVSTEEQSNEELSRVRKLKRELTAHLVWETQYLLEQSTRSTIFIQRTHSQWFASSHLQLKDWVILNFTNNNVLQSGTGAEFAGRLSPEEIVLFGCAYGDLRLVLILQKGISRDIGEMLSADRPGWRVWSNSYGWMKELSHDQRCLINFDQPIENDSNAGITDKEHYALYDSRTGCFTYLDLQAITGHCTHLVLHSTNVVRYSSSLSFESKTNASPLWIESYDLTGKRIAKTTLSGATQDSHLWFHGRTTKGDLIFEDYVSYGGTGAENPYTVTGGVFVVEIPSLKIKATHQLPVIQGGLDIKAVENTDQIVQVEGNIDLESMKTESQPHQFIVRGLDVYSGKELWRFKEDVLIRKLKEE
jgi:hypothetical protein